MKNAAIKQHQLQMPANPQQQSLQLQNNPGMNPYYNEYIIAQMPLPTMNQVA
jgi:hypothetical protein